MTREKLSPEMAYYIGLFAGKAYKNRGKRDILEFLFPMEELNWIKPVCHLFEKVRLRNKIISNGKERVVVIISNETLVRFVRSLLRNKFTNVGDDFGSLAFYIFKGYLDARLVVFPSNSSNTVTVKIGVSHLTEEFISNMLSSTCGIRDIYNVSPCLNMKYVQFYGLKNLQKLFNFYSSFLPHRETNYRKMQSLIQHLLDKANNKVSIVNHDYFGVIDNAEKAYWLGFLMADGCVTDRKYIRLRLSVKDIEHIRRFAKTIDYKGKISQTNDGKYKAVVMQFKSERMFNDLVKYGIVPRKTGKEDIPSVLPERYYPDFIRGYFDGDGCVHFSEKYNKILITITGGYAICSKVRDIFVRKCAVGCPKITMLNGVHRLKYEGKYQVKRIYDFLYYDRELTFLERKKSIFDAAFKVLL